MIDGEHHMCDYWNDGVRNTLVQRAGAPRAA